MEGKSYRLLESEHHDATYALSRRQRTCDYTFSTRVPDPYNLRNIYAATPSADRAVVRVADARGDAPGGDHRDGPEAELLRTHERANHHLRPQPCSMEGKTETASDLVRTLQCVRGHATLFELQLNFSYLNPFLLPYLLSMRAARNPLLVIAPSKQL